LYRFALILWFIHASPKIEFRKEMPNKGNSKFEIFDSDFQKKA